MPDNVIDLLESDSEEEDKEEKRTVPSNATKDVNTDDILLHPLDDLLLINDEDFFPDDERLLKEYFSIKVQKKQVLHFLNMRITVSERGISLDQTE